MTTFRSPFLGIIELTDERKSHIITAHPELKRYLKKIAQVLRSPEEIRMSRFDKNVLLFYKYFARIKNGKYISVTVKTGERNFILTAYITDVIKAGQIYENEKKSF